MGQKKRIYYIDVLKAFAIIAVVLYHAGFCKNGYLGVDLFLVIAGYLTTKSLGAKLAATNNSSGGGRFYFKFEWNRILRLLPPLIIACFVCMAIGFFVMIDDTFESLSQSVIATSFFGNNIIELIASGNYWAADKAYSPLMHTWYVGLMMQFYLIYPLLILAAKNNKKSPNQTLLSMLLILGVLSLMIFLGESNDARRFYLLPARFFEFSAGGIVALTYKHEVGKCLNKFFVYGCYILLFVLFTINGNVIPANVKLLSVVALSCVLLCSQEALDNRVTSNATVAKIGAASYSIFIWHQIVLAFYRSCFGGHLSLVDCIICLGLVVVLSWGSYLFIEQKTNRLLKSDIGKLRFYIVWGVLFVALNAFTVVIYKNAGVVRDIPELEVFQNNPQRGKWATYNCRIDSMNKPFQTTKQHWFVIGNSYARDFANIVLESDISEKVELSVCIGSGLHDLFRDRKYDELFKKADKVFMAYKGVNEDIVRNIEIQAGAFGQSLEDIIIVGDKSFGETMEQVYVRRGKDDYFNTTIIVDAALLEENDNLKTQYGDRFVDLLSYVRESDGSIRVFTDDYLFITSDCGHLTRGGAAYFGHHINWSRFLNN